MEKPKKNDQRLRIHHPYVFLFVWMGSLALGFGLVQIPVDSIWLDQWGRFWQDVMIGVSLGLGMGIGQSIALRLATGRWLRGWVLLTVIGLALGGGTLNVIYEVTGYGQSAISIAVQAFFLFIFSALAQAWLLRKHMQRVWLWVLAVAAGASITGGLVNSGDGSALLVLLGFLGYGAVTGMTLRALLNMRDSSAQKTKHAADQQVIHDRLSDTTADDNTAAYDQPHGTQRYGASS